VTIHVVGAGGMLGQDVVRAAGDRAIALTRADLDVTDRSAVRVVLSGATVINCAAYTHVDGAESDSETAHRVNADGARNVAEVAERVLYVSTDYVFDGAKSGPYVESDSTGPLQEYGHSKLAGERATAEANDNHLVVRSSWLFGPGGKNFVESMLTLGRERDELLVVDDQVGSPTFTGHLAHALVALADGSERGVLHVAGSGSCSWYGFAVAIFEQASVDAELRPCATDEFPRPARRPANSVLASERGAPELPAWQEGLEEFLGVRR
jgi:dTDP-4-dehydrorhamnose reductase